MTMKKKKGLINEQRKAVTQKLLDQLNGSLCYLVNMYWPLGDASINDDPGQINDGVSSNKLREILGTEMLSNIVAIYRMFSIFKLKGPEINFPQRIYKKISSELDELKKKGWLGACDIEDLTVKLQKKMACSGKGAEYITSSILKQIAQTGGHPLSNPARTLLIVLLASGLSEASLPKAEQHRLVADFLVEQGFVSADNVISQDAVERIFQRNSKNILAIIKEIGQTEQLRADIMFRENPDYNNKLSDTELEKLISFFNITK